MLFQHNREWIQRITKELFPDDYALMLQSILDFIHSSQSNEEMQNDLFEFLGFDKIDFIQDLLVHRQELVANLKRQTELDNESK